MPIFHQVGTTPAIAAPGGPEMWGAAVRPSETPSPQSPTPSPAGSVGSVGSQSSGYRSGELERSGQPPGVVPAPPSQPPAANMGPCVAIPLGVHSAMQKQNQHFIYLQSCHDLWDQADSLIHKGKSIGESNNSILASAFSCYSSYQLLLAYCLKFELF